jgi:hypothetical protein
MAKEEKMIANHIHDAMGQVRRMQELVLAKQRFKGYSGKARVVGAAVALLGAFAMSRSAFPALPLAHLGGWTGVLVIGIIANYGGLAIWFMRDPAVQRDLMQLKPAADALPALGIGAVLSLSLVVHEQYDLLFGSWMCLYGLVHVAYRQSLPKTNYVVGVFYMLCGTYCLLSPCVSFTNPWPMGLVFGTGELAGGIVLYRNRMEEPES